MYANATYGIAYCWLFGVFWKYRLMTGVLSVMNFTKSKIKYPNIMQINIRDPIFDFLLEIGYVCGTGM
jgi:hypothetical protein